MDDKVLTPEQATALAQASTLVAAPRGIKVDSLWLLSNRKGSAIAVVNGACSAPRVISNGLTVTDYSCNLLNGLTVKVAHWGGSGIPAVGDNISFSSSSADGWLNSSRKTAALTSDISEVEAAQIQRNIAVSTAMLRLETAQLALAREGKLFATIES